MDRRAWHCTRVSSLLCYSPVSEVAHQTVAKPRLTCDLAHLPYQTQNTRDGLFHPSPIHAVTKMPGSSRLPVSLRDAFGAHKASARGQLIALNLDLYVPDIHSQTQ
jgi:hypothetical protein